MPKPAPIQTTDQELFRKTTLCRFFSRTGRCDRGAESQFAHGGGELRGKPNLWKTALCKLWAQGRCPNGSKDCAWAHGTRELRAIRTQGSEPQTNSASEASDDVEGHPADYDSVHSQDDDHAFVHQWSPRSSATCTPSSTTTSPPSSTATPLQMGFSAFVLMSPQCGGLGNLILVPSNRLGTQTQPLLQQRCPRCQHACAMAVADCFCARCGFMLQESGVQNVAKECTFPPHHRVERAYQGRHATNAWAPAKQLALQWYSGNSSDGCNSDAPAKHQVAMERQRSSSDSSDGYDSDEEIFFERRDVSYTVRRHSM